MCVHQLWPIGQKYLCNVDKALKNSLSIEKGLYDVWTDPPVHISPTKQMWRQSILNTDCSGHEWTQSSRRFVSGHRCGSTALCSKVDNARQGQEPITTPIMPQGQAACPSTPPPHPQQPHTSKSIRHWYKIKSASTAFSPEHKATQKKNI